MRVGDEMQCGTHGKVEWRGDLVCAKCGRGENIERHPLDVCLCGERFMPQPDAKVAFSARVACPSCVPKMPKIGGVLSQIALEVAVG